MCMWIELWTIRGPFICAIMPDLESLLEKSDYRPDSHQIVTYYSAYYAGIVGSRLPQKQKIATPEYVPSSQ